jgi:putative ABC transport system permease protein
MVLWRLAFSYFRVRRVRTALTVAAIALSVSLVVSVTSGYASIEAAALKFLNRYMGGADALIIPNNPLQSAVPESLVKQIAGDPAVRAAYGRLESDRYLPGVRTVDHVTRLANGTPTNEVAIHLTGIRPAVDPAVPSLDLVEGKWFDGDSGDVAVIDEGTATKLGIQIGSELTIPGMTKLTLKVVGTVHKPQFFAERSGSLYVPLETLQKFAGEFNTPEVSRISIDFRSGLASAAFKDRWVSRLAAVDPNLHLRLRRDNAGDLEKGLGAIHMLSYLGGTVSMLTAMFIIFTALVMGVSERQRTLALLRAIGATRGQVFRLVVLEGFILAVAGTVVGTIAGEIWIYLIHWRFPDLFASGVEISYGGILFAAGGSILTALAASLLPAWSASRLSPLEAMSPLSGAHSARAPVGWALLGVALALVDPIMFFSPLERVLAACGVSDPEQAVRSVRFIGHFVCGLPCLVIGYFLVAPLLVWILEKWLAPAMAIILQVPRKLLREQLSGGLWRAAGTAAALMVGLATLIAMQIQGHTLIGGWRLPDKFPDLFIWSPDPISWADIDQLAKTPGIEPGELMPAVITTPAGDSKTALALAAAISGENSSVMFFAVDPEQALRMVKLEFRDNNGVPYPREQQPIIEAQVAREMTRPRQIIVTDEFRQARHVKIGDPFDVLTSVNGRQTYTICGIVWSPGIDVIISMFDLGRMIDQQTAGSVFGTIADAKRDFGARGARVFAANLQNGMPRDQLRKNLQKILGGRGLLVGDVRQIKFSIQNAFYRLLALISTVALAAMAVASLGVANTMMASVRSRRWQFGVLRSIGVCRGELLRLVLAEAAMLGAIAVAMGVAAGMEISMDAHELAKAVLGYSPDTIVPWNMVIGGSLTVMAVSLAASLWPAINVARSQPLDLLQAGRAST